VKRRDFIALRARATSAGNDAMLTVFPISIEMTFLVEFKPFPGV
jgi:hypothetical protein